MVLVCFLHSPDIFHVSLLTCLVWHLIMMHKQIIQSKLIEQRQQCFIYTDIWWYIRRIFFFWNTSGSSSFLPSMVWTFSPMNFWATSWYEGLWVWEPLLTMALVKKFAISDKGRESSAGISQKQLLCVIKLGRSSTNGSTMENLTVNF